VMSVIRDIYLKYVNGTDDRECESGKSSYNDNK
jgi:hypothetical protein